MRGGGKTGWKVQLPWERETRDIGYSLINEPEFFKPEPTSPSAKPPNQDKAKDNRFRIGSPMLDQVKSLPLSQ